MKTDLFEIRPYEYIPCEVKIFTIRNKPADIYDFGKYEGDAFEDPPRWCWVGKYFKARPYSENIKTAKKYGLTKEEYNKVASTLEFEFTIETCKWCI